MTKRIHFDTDGDNDAWADVNSELFNAIVSKAMGEGLTVQEAAAETLGDAANISGVDN